MPVTLQFDEPFQFTLLCTGRVAYDEIRLALDELIAHPRFGPDARVLSRAEGVTGVPSIAELCVLAADLVPLIRRGMKKLAIVVPESLVGVARTFASFAWVMNAEVRVFQNADDALRWLAASRRPTRPWP